MSHFPSSPQCPATPKTRADTGSFTFVAGNHSLVQSTFAMPCNFTNGTINSGYMPANITAGKTSSVSRASSLHWAWISADRLGSTKSQSTTPTRSGSTVGCVRAVEEDRANPQALRPITVKSGWSWREFYYFIRSVEADVAGSTRLLAVI